MKMILVGVAFAALSAASAHAECSDTVYGKVAPSYIYKDFGTTASADPVVQGGYNRTCGKWSFGPWASIGKGFGNEVDLLAFYDTKTGPVKLQLSAQYYFVNGKGGLLNFKNGLAEFYADASVPMQFGKLSIAPLVRGLQTVGVKNFRSLTLVEPGVRLGYAFTDRFSLTADIRDAVNMTQGYSTWRFDGTATWKLDEHNTLKAEYEDTDRTGKVVSLNFVRTF